MKRQILSLIFLLLLLPIATTAENRIPIKIEGRIGDFAKKSKTYEINGEIYQFQANIIIENQYGRRLTFDDLEGGLFIKIIGEKIIETGQREKIEFNKIIVMKKK